MASESMTLGGGGGGRNEALYAERLANLVMEELRGFRKEMNDRIDKLVTQESFAQEQRRVDERIADLRADLEAEQTARAADMAALREKSEKLKSNVRWLVSVALAPTAFFIADKLWGGP